MLKRLSTAIIICIGLWLADRLLSATLNPYHLQITIEIGIAIILAVSLNLINGFTGQFSLGHAGFMAVGGYCSAALTFYYAPQWIEALSNTGMGPAAAKQLVFFGALAISALTAAIAGFLVGLPTLRLRGDYLAIATLGFGEIIRLIINNRPEVGGASGFTPMVQIPQFVNLFWIYLFVIITIMVSANLLRSAHGRALLSIREDEVAAQVMGVPITYYKVMAFALGAAFAGIAGCLSGHYRLGLHPNDFDVIASVMIVIMVVLGGMGSITGCTVAAILLTLLSYALRSTLGLMVGSLVCAAAILLLLAPAWRLPKNAKLSMVLAILAALALGLVRSQVFLAERVAELRMLLFSGLLVMIMLTRPQGLLGGREISWAGIVKRFTLRRRQTDGPA
ncbi:MAG: branched-chain amino acid ABC transporter permease [Armatimonadetes bacterium]|nr:branched-chain amino acid ABC transporter permease [Armatimonadota bacterium]NIM23127.1 branched-chain amino acid ABC transporter permease [Armatimonadota bacterium]NIM66995.1 branched-chain amino acid ABC transporter permease [Armatimonadota bacterium]NIM75529.1 branched-chain amino acid ABC transporter permease [Armatimonadota bacterium]NIN05184.1 branched-chain amino acid ABC transporter permease [Armatimonadota bacterium]